MAAVLTLLSAFLTVVFCDQLLFVHVLNRHGARSPVRTYRSSPLKNAWPAGVLLPQGKREMFNLGRKLGSRYLLENSLLGSEYDEEESYIVATLIHRTQVSALSLLSGLYSVANDTVDVEDENAWEWHLGKTPVVNFTHTYNPLYYYECDIAKDLIDIHYNTTEVRELLEDAVQLRKGLTAHSEEYVAATENSILKVCNGIITELNIGGGPNHTWQREFYEPCEAFEAKSLKMRYGMAMPSYNNNSLRIDGPRAFGGKLISDMLHRMELQLAAHSRSIPPDSASKLKLFVYSAHELNLIIFGSLLDFEFTDYDRDALPATSTAWTVELWVNDRNESYVKVLYWRRDSESFVDVTNEISGCEQGCTLEAFRARSKKYLPPDDYASFCDSRVSDIPREKGYLPNFSKLHQKQDEILAALAVISFFL